MNDAIVVTIISIYATFSLCALVAGCLELSDRKSSHRKLAAWMVLTFWLGPLWAVAAIGAGIGMAAKKVAEALRIVRGRV
jgi:uncharacterized membrane protein